MKKKDLEKGLKQLGWRLKRQGGNHEIWTNGEDSKASPRHREIREYLKKKILEVAKNHPAKKNP